MSHSQPNTSELQALQKRQLLAKLLQQQAAKQQNFPLSFAQKRLWFLEQLQPGLSVYNVPSALRLTGKLNINGLGQSLQSIVRRHEILHSSFSVVDDEPVQNITANFTLTLPLVDLRGLSPEHQAAQVMQQANLLTVRPFQLTQAPLFRVALLQLSTTEYVLLFVMHHIIADYWSMRVLVRELALLYQGYSKGQPSILPDLSIQYVDFATWQQKWLQSEARTTQLTYWKEQLQNCPCELSLPIDYPRPARQTFKGARQFFTLSLELSDRLRQLSQQQGATLFMTMLTAFNVLLYRYSGQKDILVGSTVTSRDRPEIANLIGLFVNNLVFRTNLSGNPSFCDLLNQVRETVLAALSHQELPFEDLVEQLQPERNLSQNPLFQVMFILHNTKSQSTNLAGLTIEPLETEHSTARFDLSLDMSETPRGLTGTFEYSTDLFQAATIDRLIHNFQTLLHGIGENPDQHIAELPLLTENEQQQLLVQWNDTVVEIPDLCVQELFAQQAQRTPDKIAVIFENKSLTYIELNTKANQLADYLQKLGVQTETRVGICCDRSLEMAIALLAVLKAGAAYIPLDPAYPQERLGFILQDAQISILLTQNRLLNLLPENPAEILCIDTQLNFIDNLESDNPLVKVDPNQLAYLIYTSGSTGTPKGVQILHRGLTNFLNAMAKMPGLTAKDSLLAVTTLAFDIAALEIFLPLIVGASLVLVQREVTLDGVQLAAAIEQHQITVMQATPATWRLLLASGWRGKEDLKILCGGEALDNSLAQQLISFSREVWNLYGPTETTIWSAVQKLSPRESVTIGRPIANTLFYVLDDHLQPVPVGVPGELYIGGVGVARGYWQRPELTAQRFLANPFGKGVGSGEWGVGSRGGGEQGSKGELKLNSSTSELDESTSEPQGFQCPMPHDATCFKSAEPPNAVAPPCPMPNALYKTGDRVRYLKNGNLEYLGRLDNQVKIRGYRIELGEIEGVLQKHPEVAQAVVTLKEDEPRERRLVAYIVPNTPHPNPPLSKGRELEPLPNLPQGIGRELEPLLNPPQGTGRVPDRAGGVKTAIRSFLATKLPVYMIPTAIVVLEKLPLTPNGKVDRLALPDADVNSVATTVTAPHTPTEELLAGIWASVLGIESVGIDDNFFNLGGHSLFATRVVSQIRQVFSVELPLRHLFETPILANLALVIDQMRQSQSLSVAPAILPIQRTGNLPLSFAQQRFWVLSQLEPDSPFYNIPLAVEIQGDIDLGILQRSFDEMVQRQEILRTTFQSVDGQPVLRIADFCQINILAIDLQALAANEQQQEIEDLLLSQQPFNLEDGPLLRVQLLRLGRTSHVLLLTLHHIIADAWSMGLLVRDVVGLYHAQTQRRKEEEEKFLSVQYVDFAYWQREWLQGEVLEGHLGYWRQQLADVPALLELPTDYSRPAVQSFRGAVHRFGLSSGLTEALKQLSQRHHSTLFMTLLATLNVLLHRYTGSDDIVVGSAIANRNRIETESLIGCFANTLALRSDLSGYPTFEMLLQRVRATALGAYAHQDLPFEQLVEVLQPMRSLSHTPIFQVMLVLQNLPLPELDMAGMQWQILDVDSGTAKFDLTWIVSETREGLSCKLEYNTDLFTAPTIARLAGHLETLLEAVVANPQQPIAELPLLSIAEKQQLGEWNQTQREYPDGQCLHELFTAQVRQTPKHTAVIWGRESLSYQELNTKANQLAHYLQRLGVQPEVPVGICVNRSLDMIIGLLGILKAGGAYVSLDPSYPQERLGLIIQNAQIQVLITQQHQLPKLPSLDIPVICLDTDAEAISLENTANPINSLTPDNLAYIIYTSGTTGISKGVAISHRSPVTLISWAKEVYSTAQLAGVLASTSICFDLSVFEIFVPLSWGGSVILADNALELLELPAAGQVTLLNTVPSAARELLRLNAIPASVRTVNLAGESLPKSLVQQLYQQSTIDQVFNLYGPSEDTTYSTFTLIPKHSHQAPTIGHPIANTQVYILDKNLQPLPIGVPGEIYLGGAGIARGYWQQPDLTAQRFVPNPLIGEWGVGSGEWGNRGMEFKDSFTSIKDSSASIKDSSASIKDSFTSIKDSFTSIKDSSASIKDSFTSIKDSSASIKDSSASIKDSSPIPNAPCPMPILYKTGDRARYLPDGTIEYLGRWDHQVKLRGFRIELGEIEAVLHQHPGVLQAVAIARQDTLDHARLVAYVVPKSKLQETELRQFLAAKLPGYMVPSALVIVETLPLTVNGKVDRRALPIPELRPVNTSFTVSRTPLEQQLVTIWSQVLGVESISIHDNFFSLGGDSILAIQVVAKANQQGLALLPRQMFQYQTVAELAAIVDTIKEISIPQEAVTGDIPLTPIQHWFFEENLVDPHHWNQAILLEVQQPLNFTWLRQALEKIITHHDGLRSHYPTPTLPLARGGREISDFPPMHWGGREISDFSPLQGGIKGGNTTSVYTLYVDLSELAVVAPDKVQKTITTHADDLQASFDLNKPPLLRVAYFNLGEQQRHRLLIIIHHLIVDGISWRILLEDLQLAYQQLNQKQEIQLPPKTTSFQQWATQLRDYTQTANLQPALDYWTSPSWQQVTPLPIDDPQGCNRMADVDTYSVSLSSQDTQVLLQQVPAAYHTQINDILLTALVLAFHSWSGDRHLLVELEGHGREDLFPSMNLSRTVGWFTSLFPVLLNIDASSELGDSLKTIKEQLRQVPNRGISYGLLRYLASPTIQAKLRAVPSPQVRFNYLGQSDQIFSQSSLFIPARESVGHSRSQRGTRNTLIEINSIVTGGQLRFDWFYSRTRHQQQTIATLAKNYQTKLRSLIQHCLSPNANGFTPSDFPQMQLTQAELDKLLADI
ncbi:amino acid adenylation domain-containing protein [Nostoc sp. CHAB 5784]|uniref:non-ribosomal peptide synthetase n=1 Tax=Nostoc mirabile TaxID=2907820 RepID=UPI001E41C7D4|nr:non-ribosomal peptide synthetase [Nostoc mirabile]MCC5667069.1 amino acid adenylation domain-containing protein [Nostoc mirabile CHAB5784]